MKWQLSVFFLVSLAKPRKHSFEIRAICAIREQNNEVAKLPKQTIIENLFFDVISNLFQDVSGLSLFYIDKNTCIYSENK